MAAGILGDFMASFSWAPSAMAFRAPRIRRTFLFVVPTSAEFPDRPAQQSARQVAARRVVAQRHCLIETDRPALRLVP